MGVEVPVGVVVRDVVSEIVVETLDVSDTDGELVFDTVLV